MCYAHALVLHLVLGKTDWEKPFGGLRSLLYHDPNYTVRALLRTLCDWLISTIVRQVVPFPFYRRDTIAVSSNLGCNHTTSE